MRPKSRIMYIENKENGLVGDARVGRVTFSQNGKTLYYDGKAFQSLKGRGFKSNYFEVGTMKEYWISGCRKDGRDSLYSNKIEIDEDVWEEYWREIRNLNPNKDRPKMHFSSKYGK